MLLREVQIRDYKGAALMIDALPMPKPCSAIEVTTPTGSAPLSPTAR